MNSASPVTGDLSLLAQRAQGTWSGFDPIQSAATRFQTLGIPTQRHEEWKYTNVTDLKKFQFTWGQSSAVAADQLAPYLIGSSQGYPQAIFINGVFSKEHSQLGKFPDGVIVTSLLAATKEHSALVKKHFGTIAKNDHQPFVALNSATSQDGLFVYVPAGVRLEKPIHLLQWQKATNGDQKALICPRHLWVVSENAQCEIIEHYVGERGDYFTNVVSEAIIAPSANFTHYRLQREGANAYHINHLQIHQGKDSQVVTHNFNFGGHLVRHNVEVFLAGTGCHSSLYGLSVLQGNQLVDNHTRIDHAMPHCNSWEVYKNVLADKSTGVFNGKIHVHQDAQKTDAKQTNNTLLLSTDATMNSKPELEIYADDVKCTHGATIGQLDRNALFYLKSRGIDQASATALLTHAFAADLIEKLNDTTAAAFKEELRRVLLTRLPVVGDV